MRGCGNFPTLNLKKKKKIPSLCEQGVGQMKICILENLFTWKKWQSRVTNPNLFSGSQNFGTAAVIRPLMVAKSICQKHWKISHQSQNLWSILWVILKISSFSGIFLIFRGPVYGTMPVHFIKLNIDDFYAFRRGAGSAMDLLLRKNWVYLRKIGIFFGKFCQNYECCKFYRSFL